MAPGGAIFPRKFGPGGPYFGTPAPYSNTSSENNSNNIADENISKIWVRIPFLGKQGEYLVKKLIRKLQHNLTKPVKFIVIYQTKKVSYFLSKKDKIPDSERNNLVYEFSCPGCSATYIGKTVRNLRTRLSEHAKLNTSAVSEHLTTCEHARHIADLHNLYDNVNMTSILTSLSMTMNLSLITLKYCSHSNTQTLISYSFWKRFI